MSVDADLTHIPLSKGMCAIVDPGDATLIAGYGKWTYHNAGYAYRFDRSVSPAKCLLMHRVIMDAPKELQVDHINGDKLDNRRSNLRIVSRAGNNLNRKNAKLLERTSGGRYVVRVKIAGYKQMVTSFDEDSGDLALHTAHIIREQLIEAGI